jgi:AcrR family transcriptional regulator
MGQQIDSAMPKPRYQRRKEERPAEITQAAMEAFAAKGYAATKVEDVAKRAGVSKGLLYLYFKTKEELFKAVILNFISPHLDALIRDIENTELSAEQFLRGPFLAFAKSVPRSPARVLVRLMIAEGPRHPDLVTWYWENVVSKGLKAITTVLEKGVRNGEFRRSALHEFPQLLVSPILLATVWTQVFDAHEKLDTDRLMESHINLTLNSIKASQQ